MKTSLIICVVGILGLSDFAIAQRGQGRGNNQRARGQASRRLAPYESGRCSNVTTTQPAWGERRGPRRASGGKGWGSACCASSGEGTDTGFRNRRGRGAGGQIGQNTGQMRRGGRGYGVGRGVQARGTGTCLRAFDASAGPGEVMKGNRGGRSWNARSRGSGTGPCMNYRGPGRRWGASGNSRGCGWTGQGVSLADDTVANEALRQALHNALVDEYKNQQYYENVMEKFGRSRRFQNLTRAEARHADALLSLFTRYQLEPPKRDATKAPEVPGSLKAAIELAIEQEKANVALYDELLQSEYPEDVRIVLGHLRDASASRHLPALQRGL